MGRGKVLGRRWRTKAKSEASSVCRRFSGVELASPTPIRSFLLHKRSNPVIFYQVQQDPKHGLSRSIPPLGVVGCKFLKVRPLGLAVAQFLTCAVSRSTVIYFVIERSLVRFWERRHLFCQSHIHIVGWG
jgi:hypothetical protein